MNTYMSHNVLLVKGDVGQMKPFTHDLPGLEHTYGKRNPMDLCNAGKLISSWKEYQIKRSASQERDFIKVNKLILKDQSPESLKDILRKPRYESRPTYKESFKDLSKDGTAYGKSTPYLIPIKSIINGDIGNETEK
jgi:hypothetical protein